MPTPAERKALLFLAAVVSLGAGVRVVRAALRDAPSDQKSTAALQDQLRRVDSARVAKAGKRTGRAAHRTPKAAAPRRAVDMDTASVELIESLNGIGPALAERIVANRDSLGAFGSVEALTRVRGIGPALSAKLAPQVTFSRLPRPQNAVISPPILRRRPPKPVEPDRGFP